MTQELTNTQLSQKISQLEKRVADLEKLLNEEPSDLTTEFDPLFNKVCQELEDREYCSSSFIQRVFGIGYAHAARISAQLLEKGMLIRGKGDKPHKVNSQAISDYLSTQISQASS